MDRLIFQGSEYTDLHPDCDETFKRQSLMVRVEARRKELSKSYGGPVRSKSKIAKSDGRLTIETDYYLSEN